VCVSLGVAVVAATYSAAVMKLPVHHPDRHTVNRSVELHFSGGESSGRIRRCRKLQVCRMVNAWDCDGMPLAESWQKEGCEQVVRLLSHLAFDKVSRRSRWLAYMLSAQQLLQEVEISYKEGQKLEGLFAKLWQAPYFYALASNNAIKTICEVGFNTGHSALLWLWANRKSDIISFDLGQHAAVQVGFEFLSARFPGRLDLVRGNSSETVPEYSKACRHHQHCPQSRCDIVYIDGGHQHDQPWIDLTNMRRLSHENTIVLMDDTTISCSYPSSLTGENCSSNPGWAWTQAIREGMIIPHECLQDDMWWNGQFIETTTFCRGRYQM